MAKISDYKKKLISVIEEIEDEQGVKVKSVNITREQEHLYVFDGDPQFIDFKIDIEI